jgi:hypothetical protein
MAPVTTRFKAKPFTWSYSRLKNFEVCPKKHWEIDIAKNVKETEGEQLVWGNAVHAALAKRIDKGEALPQTMHQYEKWALGVLAGADQPGVQILVEQKLAITKDFGACEYFDDGVWFRGVGDVIKLWDEVALTVDWKTGKILEDSVQLALTAACIFAAYPHVQAVRSEFVWLKEDATTREDFRREDMPGLWRGLWPRIEALENAHKHTDYPAVHGRLCKKHCPVSSCPYFGKPF